MLFQDRGALRDLGAQVGQCGYSEDYVDKRFRSQIFEQHP